MTSSDTLVINGRVKFLRPMYNNLRECLQDKHNVYIGRGRCIFIDGVRYPERDSVFANPFKSPRDGTYEEILEKYEQYLNVIVARDDEIKEELLSLKGKNLVCWCEGMKDKRCHGHIIIKILKTFDEEEKDETVDGEDN